MASGLPKLPGYYPSQDIERTNFKRISAWKREEQLQSKNEPILVYPLPRQRDTYPPQKPLSKSFHPNYISTQHASFKPTFTGELDKRFLPTYVKLDKQVLRFYGFFKESVPESPTENYRIRKLTIVFYLEDHSIAMSESQQTNSGIVQGPFLKRQKVLRADGSGKFINVFDFKIGEPMNIYGKSIMITDCDTYTREFYELNGKPQGPSMVPPQDDYSLRSSIKYIPKKDQALKEYLESQLGGGRQKSQKQFLENDRKVLRFFCQSGDNYVLHYYLADDTVEIREVNYANSGKDSFGLMMKRRRLPKTFALNQPGLSVEDNFVSPDDIRDGRYLNVFGRRFFIMGCDKFTQDYYKQKYNYEFPLGQVELPKPKPKVEYVPPPYNGFGSEEDSLSHCNRLLGKAPNKDYYKWMDNQYNLKFIAKFKYPRPEDAQREFIITFYLNDDSVMVYEPYQRNSGINGGKFLEKGKYKNALNNNAYFQPGDFLIGHDVIINGFQMTILDSDKATKKWYANNFKNEA